MRFTEHELTAALTGAAKAVLATQRKDVRRGRADIDTVWDEMDRYQRFQLLDQLGSEILPVLVALPDVEVATGTRPTYTDREVTETVEALLGDGLGKAAPRGPRQDAHRAGAVRAGAPAAAPGPRRPGRARPSLSSLGLPSRRPVRGAPGSVVPPPCSRATYSSMFSTSSTLRRTTANRSLIVATSSTCSLTNHWRNCSEAKSVSSRAIRSSPLICSVTRRLLVERELDGRHDALEGGDRRLHPGDHDLRIGVEEVLHHHQRVAALLERLGVEERRHLGHRQRVVVDRTREVLVLSGELLADLDVQGLDEAICGHAHSSTCGVRRPWTACSS